MKKYTLILLTSLILFPTTSLLACLNGFDDFFHDAVLASRKKFPIPLGHPLDTKDPEMRAAMDYNKQGYQKGKYEPSIDYGLFLIYDKQYEEAEKVFAKLAEKYANKYEVAANYGTILEVNGKNEEALKWIKKAIAIDPNSHDGSEWIHVAILEAKIRGDQPVSGSRMTGFDFGLDSLPQPILSEKQLKKLQKELFFQLNERVTFIPPKDPYIAALLFELGNVALALDQRKSAAAIYKKAKAYGFADPIQGSRIAIAQSKRPISAPLDTILPIPAAPAPMIDTTHTDTLTTSPPVTSESHSGGSGGMLAIWLGIGAAFTALAGWLMTKLLRGMK